MISISGTIDHRQENAKLIDTLTQMRGGVSTAAMEKTLPIVEQIRELKKEKNVVVLAHYYMSPILQVPAEAGGVADFVGDSLGLSLAATKVEAENIVFCGVNFMAETAYILNPDKQVYTPSREAGCSLASSINAADVRKLKEQYPGVPVIAYINTYAETKAEVDICCTSRNALKVAESFDSDRLIFVPDVYMGRNLQEVFAKQSRKQLILWNGKCEVHEQFSENLYGMSEAYPEAEILLHWEVPDRSVQKLLSSRKGMVGSTTDILSYAGSSSAGQFILGSECDLGATLKGMYPQKEFITPCIICYYMKKVNIRNVLTTLLAIGSSADGNHRIEIDEDTRRRAYHPVKRMLDIQ